MTIRDIITLALKMSNVVGKGQAPSAEDITDGFNVLNMMLDGWARKRWLSFHEQDLIVPLTGVPGYTIGSSGADIIFPRPERIQGAYTRQINLPAQATVDFPLRILQSREEYAGISVKGVTGGPPALLWYDAGWPVGTIYIWPIPVGGMFELHLLIKQPLSEFLNLSNPTALPPEYSAAMMWNLAAELRPMYDLPPDPTVTAKALTSLNTLRVENFAIQPLALPGNVPGAGGGSYGSGYGGFLEQTATIPEWTLS